MLYYCHKLQELSQDQIVLTVYNSQCAMQELYSLNGGRLTAQSREVSKPR